MADLRSIGIGMQTNVAPIAKGLDSAYGSITGFASRVTGAFAVAGLAIDGASTVAGGLWNILSSPITAAAEAEKTAVSFETLTGSASQADKTLADLRKFAAETPFEFPELADSARSLIALGFNAKDVTATLRKLGDVGSGLDIPLKDLAIMFGRVSNEGRLDTQSFNQMVERGVPLIEEFAKIWGVSETAVRKMVSSGKADFGTLQTAINNLTTGSGRYAGLMEKQSSTIGGMWANFSDNMGMIVQGLGTKIIETFRLKDALTFFNNFLDSSQSTFDSYLDNFSIGMTAVTPLFEQLGNVVVARFNSIVETGAWLFNSLAGFWGSVGGPTFQTMKDFIFDSLVVMEFGFTNFWGILQLGATQGLLSIVQFAASIQHQFTTVIPSYLSWFGNNWQEIIGWMLNEAIGRFSSFFSNLISLFKNLPGLIAGTTDWSKVWKPFQATALESVVDLPQIPDRVKGQFEKELAISVADQSNNLSTGLGDLLNKRRSELMGPEQTAPLAAAVASAPPTATTTTSKSSDAPKKIVAGSLFGSKSANESIMRHQMRSSGQTSKDPVKIQQEQLQIAKREEARQKRMERHLSIIAGDAGNSQTINIS